MKPALYTNIKECAPTGTLERYQQGKLDKGEHQSVASHLSTCQLCQFTTTAYPRIDKREMDEDMAKIKRRITDRLFEQKRKKRRQFLSKVAAGLLFLLTAGIGTYFFTTSGVTTSTDVYAQHYQSYEVAEDLLQKARDNSPTISVPLAKAIATYKNIPYQAPTTNIPTSAEQIPEDVALTRLLTALTDLENGRVNSAIALLEKVQKGTTNFSEDAAWYLALAHIKNGVPAKANSYLDSLVARKEGTYYTKAQALKADLVSNRGL